MKRVVGTLLLFVTILISRPSVAQLAISVSFGPPPLPVYVQPPCPADGYIWTPGYWAYDPYFDYYWVPGTWVLAPQPGFLWTPGWWGWNDGAFLFHEGYWGPHIGFYGGINYGFGYFGNGYAGGRWDGNHFYYNRAVSNINVTNIHNVYNTKIENNVTVNRISYNGGKGGIEARPSSEEEAASRDHHIAPEQSQLHHLQMARANPQLRAAVNHGKPAIAATARPGVFSGQHVVAARAAGGAYQANAPKLDHANNVPAHQAPSPGHSASAAQEEQREQSERALVDRQNQQHSQLQAQQQREHEQAQQKNAGEQQQREMEQRHAQQTSQMEQHHMQQMQNLQRPQPQSRPAEPARPEGKPHH